LLAAKVQNVFPQKEIFAPRDIETAWPSVPQWPKVFSTAELEKSRRDRKCLVKLPTPLWVIAKLKFTQKLRPKT
jgi:hypothetical protein